MRIGPTMVGFACGALLTSVLAVAQSRAPIGPVHELGKTRDHCVSDSYCGFRSCGGDDCQCCADGGGMYSCRVGPCNP